MLIGKRLMHSMVAKDSRGAGLPIRWAWRLIGYCHLTRNNHQKPSLVLMSGRRAVYVSRVAMGQFSFFRNFHRRPPGLGITHSSVDQESTPPSMSCSRRLTDLTKATVTRNEQKLADWMESSY